MSKATQTAQQESQAHQLANDLRDQALRFRGRLPRSSARCSCLAIRSFWFASRFSNSWPRLSQPGSLKKNGYVGSSIECRHCGRSAKFHCHRERNPVGLGGMVSCRRAYYYCGNCGKGFCPWDEQVGLTEQGLTPGVARLATLAGGVADSFEKGGELLEEMASIRLSVSSIQRITEAAGRRIVETYAQGKTYGSFQPWQWFQDAQQRTVAYVGLDATGVRQQGPHGEKAEGRMANVGAIFNPLPDPERVFSGLPKPGTRIQARYVSGLYPLAEMGPLLRQQGAQVGMDQAEIWIALTDGGIGLESFMEMNFPRVAAVILDFWHASEYLAKLAKVLIAQDEEKATAQTQQWSRILKEEGGTTMIAVLEEWEWPERVSGLQETRQDVLQYFRNQETRMDYPTYEANGWYIGSGTIESSCKTVVGQRMKGSGMRWGEDGAHEVCHVRALYRSERGQWQAFWQREIQN